MLGKRVFDMQLIIEMKWDHKAMLLLDIDILNRLENNNSYSI